MRGIDQILVLVAAIVAAGAGLYAKHEHGRATELQGKVAEVTRERDGYSRALDAQKVAEKKAAVRAQEASDRLAAAIRVNPTAAETIVPDAVWDAIYGNSNAGN
ncbi:hypothetical protein Bsp3421_003959 [Burkholderia sp. FERM BP-3421]|uniref:hypothetical protein n=1 Tax=Burkholderia sp. FERM BP-3421 TaxID=1494466 RepID=UPI00235F65EC|nr:hypothetical protein [Burkholderia sp. FERM BP-3421]WDD93858.1 hypothetical protein Bsp3421_003959 [Burkholderia sp. FERM BP-3421]